MSGTGHSCYNGDAHYGPAWSIRLRFAPYPGASQRTGPAQMPGFLLKVW